MNKFVYLALGMVLGVAMVLFADKAFASEKTWGECVSVGAQCGTDNGVQTREVKEYADPICPMFYEVKNSGNWSQRCHRIYRWVKPEHKAPIGCPEEFEQDGANCSKIVVKEQSCQTGEIQYDSCEQAGECPTECGYEGGEVADGQGGYIVCEPTLACEIPVEEVEESTPSEKKDNNTFHKDTRCHDTTPPAITWVKVEDGNIYNNWFPQATWSAEGGSEVEVCFSETLGDPRWCFVMENDGKQEFGHIAPDNTGELGMVNYYSNWRTINGCKEGDWLPVSWFN